MQTWALIALTVVLWGAWAVTERIAVKHMSPMMVTLVIGYVYTALAPVLFLYMKATGEPMVWNSRGIVWSTVTCIFAAIAGLTFVHALQKAPTYIVVGFTSVYPLVTMLFCAVFLGEQVTFMKVVGIVTIVAGTVMLGM